jgi:hypothetical protein
MRLWLLFALVVLSLAGPSPAGAQHAGAPERETTMQAAGQDIPDSVRGEGGTQQLMARVESIGAQLALRMRHQVVPPGEGFALEQVRRYLLRQAGTPLLLSPHCERLPYDSTAPPAAR